MKKLLAAALAVVTLVGASVQSAHAVAAPGRGGVAGFFVGCCFGLRSGAAFNEGKDVHFRQWCRLIPYVNIVFAIWDGIDGANGVTVADMNAKYPGNFY